MRDAMMKAALYGFGAKLPQFNPNYCYVLQWQFEEDNSPMPHEHSWPTAMEALDQMIGLWNSGKTLIHISLSRRNA